MKHFTRTALLSLSAIFSGSAAHADDLYQITDDQGHSITVFEYTHADAIADITNTQAAMRDYLEAEFSKRNIDLTDPTLDFITTPEAILIYQGTEVHTIPNKTQGFIADNFKSRLATHGFSPTEQHNIQTSYKIHLSDIKDTYLPDDQILNRGGPSALRIYAAEGADTKNIIPKTCIYNSTGDRKYTPIEWVKALGGETHKTKSSYPAIYSQFFLEMVKGHELSHCFGASEGMADFIGAARLLTLFEDTHKDDVIAFLNLYKDLRVPASKISSLYADTPKAITRALALYNENGVEGLTEQTLWGIAHRSFVKNVALQRQKENSAPPPARERSNSNLKVKR